MKMNVIMSAFQIVILCLSLITLKGQYKIVYDESEQLITPLQCGSEVLIKHRASDLCLTMTKNKYNANLTQIGLKTCYEIDTNQRWIIHCCDQYLLRCGKYNPFVKEGEPITYDSYFQIQQKMTKLCISTANIWKHGQNNQSVYLQQCQLSLLDCEDSTQSIKIQRDKFLFNDGDENGNTAIYTNHLTQFINLYHPLCLGYDLSSTQKLLKGYNCNISKDKKKKLTQFKFIPFLQTQITSTPHTDF
eukprot:497235_1